MAFETKVSMRCYFESIIYRATMKKNFYGTLASSEMLIRNLNQLVSFFMERSVFALFREGNKSKNSFILTNSYTRTKIPLILAWFLGGMILMEKEDRKIKKLVTMASRRRSLRCMSESERRFLFPMIHV